MNITDLAGYSVLALVVIMVLWIGIGLNIGMTLTESKETLSDSGPSVQEMGTEACHEAFNESFDYQGWSGTYPPSIQCNGPNGYLGTAPMPAEMQEELKIVTPESHE